ncbi:MAG: hypothetical protein J5I90_17010 [Caldilineales bacterium]|nr:hypothetical protein [Caldilineales bacterium]
MKMMTLRFSRSFWVRCCLAALLALAVVIPGLGLLAPTASYAAVSCSNLLQNSDMESNSGWLFGFTAVPGSYSTAESVSPTRSARLGIASGSNANSFSSMRQQVTVPNGVELKLRVKVFPLSQPYDGNDLQEIRILDAAGSATLKQLWSGVSNSGTWQDLQFDLNEFMGQTITVYVNVFNNGADGKTAMYVDNLGLRFCIDDGPTSTPTSTTEFVTATPTPTSEVVTATPTSIVVTNTPTPTQMPGFVTATSTPVVVTNTPTPTHTPGFVTATSTPIVVTNTPTPTQIIVTNTPTPTSPPGVITATPTFSFVTSTPTATPTWIVITNTPGPVPTYTSIPPSPGGECKECLRNVSFENWQSWYFGKTVLRGGYSGAQHFTGVRSAALGRVNTSQPNYNSYSSVRQKAALPRGPWRTATLTFHHYTISDLEYGDYQELVILDANSGRTLEVPWRVNRNDQTWLEEEIDLTRYLGRSIIIYFNVFNQGGSGSAGMYVDEVTLSICGGSGSGGGTSPIPTPQPPVQDFAPEVSNPELDDLVATATSPGAIIISGTIDGVPPVDDLLDADALATIDASGVFSSVITTPTPEAIVLTLEPTADLPATVEASLTLTPESGRNDNSGGSSDGDMPFWRRLLQPAICLTLIIVAVVLFVIIRFITGLMNRESHQT